MCTHYHQGIISKPVTSIILIYESKTLGENGRIRILICELLKNNNQYYPHNGKPTYDANLFLWDHKTLLYSWLWPLYNIPNTHQQKSNTSLRHSENIFEKLLKKWRLRVPVKSFETNRHNPNKIGGRCVNMFKKIFSAHFEDH